MRTTTHGYACDRCGTQVTIDSKETRPAGWVGMLIVPVKDPADLCAVCAVGLNDWMRRRSDTAMSGEYALRLIQRIQDDPIASAAFDDAVNCLYADD